MIRLDMTGFPVLHCRGLGLGVGLLPVTRVQFEYFLGDTTGFPPDRYEEIERLNPRASWRSIPNVRLEGMFLTDVQPEEAERFGTWLGEGFRLPTEAEWREADAAFGAVGGDLDRLLPLTRDTRVHPTARAILGWRANQPGVRSLRTVGLLDGGLLEWVRRTGPGYGLHGRPLPSIPRLLHNPQVHPAVEPLDKSPNPGFGFRLVRPW